MSAHKSGKTGFAAADVAESDVSTFINAFRDHLQPVSDDGTAVEVVLTALEGLLIKIVNGDGRFEGLSKGQRDRDQDRAIDEAVSVLSGLLGRSARLAVCMAILAVGIGNKHSHLAIAA